MNLLAYYYARRLQEILTVEPGKIYMYDAGDSLHDRRSKKLVRVYCLETPDHCICSELEEHDIGFDTRINWLQPDPQYLKKIYNVIIRDIVQTKDIIPISHYSPDYVMEDMRNQPVIVLRSEPRFDSDPLVYHLNSKGIVNASSQGWLTGVLR